jgi:hypothetical protein
MNKLANIKRIWVLYLFSSIVKAHTDFRIRSMSLQEHNILTQENLKIANVNVTRQPGRPKSICSWINTPNSTEFMHEDAQCSPGLWTIKPAPPPPGIKTSENRPLNHVHISRAVPLLCTMDDQFGMASALRAFSWNYCFVWYLNILIIKQSILPAWNMSHEFFALSVRALQMILMSGKGFRWWGGGEEMRYFLFVDTNFEQLELFWRPYGAHSTWATKSACCAEKKINSSQQ